MQVGASAPNKILDIPQGLSRTQFNDLSQAVRAKAKDLGLGDDIFVQGSRAGGTAKSTSDIDLAIRVSPEKFDDFLHNQSKLSNVNPGTAKERTLLHAIETGKIQSGEARLSALRKQLEQSLNMEVDLSIIRAGGKFDNGPQLPLPIIE
jgi:predicted nucleotidyltransferase